MAETPKTPQPQSSNRTIMLILAYLGILALIPLLVEKEDQEIQWHAKHGLILTATWIVLGIALAVLSNVPVLGWALGCFALPILWILILVIHIVAIVKALQGERLVLPVITDFVAKWE